ncbi:MAG: hypothetical protein A2156_11540 [Deltaproteobacteria bacterium RBG_16_48_10]|nr:MAG: hypothetical protein A2156_11540 [Deltaproteobacteria bacterium RBG_16_48_10]
MNLKRTGQILIIFLFIMVSVGFCFAVEIRVWNDKTKKFETFEPTPEEKAKMEKQEAQMRREKAKMEEEKKRDTGNWSLKDSSAPKKKVSTGNCPLSSGPKVYMDPQTGKIIAK